jgi:hypothetical protein
VKERLMIKKSILMIKNMGFVGFMGAFSACSILGYRKEKRSKGKF